MTLEEFAKKCGVTIHRCGTEYGGGRFAYKSTDYPNTTIAGFWTESAAYKSWMASTFGKDTAKVVAKLLKESK
jgi:hypothetical protein